MGPTGSRGPERSGRSGELWCRCGAVTGRRSGVPLLHTMSTSCAAEAGAEGLSGLLASGSAAWPGAGHPHPSVSMSCMRCGDVEKSRHGVPRGTRRAGGWPIRPGHGGRADRCCGFATLCCRCLFVSCRDSRLSGRATAETPFGGRLEAEHRRRCRRRPDALASGFSQCPFGTTSCSGLKESEGRVSTRAYKYTTLSRLCQEEKHGKR